MDGWKKLTIRKNNILQMIKTNKEENQTSYNKNTKYVPADGSAHLCLNYRWRTPLSQILRYHLLFPHWFLYAVCFSSSVPLGNYWSVHRVSVPSYLHLLHSGYDYIRNVAEMWSASHFSPLAYSYSGSVTGGRFFCYILADVTKEPSPCYTRKKSAKVITFSRIFRIFAARYGRSNQDTTGVE